MLIFDKYDLYLRGRLAINCRTAFSLHVVESASDDYNISIVLCYHPCFLLCIVYEILFVFFYFFIDLKFIFFYFSLFIHSAIHMQVGRINYCACAA